MRVAPMAYSQQTGYFYAVGNAWLRWRRRAEDPYFFSPDRRVPGVSDFAVLAAIDSRTNKIAWRQGAADRSSAGRRDADGGRTDVPGRG